MSHRSEWSDDCGTVGGELADGFAFPREQGLADWRFRKEEQEFGVLVNRLRVRKWQKEAQADPCKVIPLRARKLAYALKAEVKERGNEAARQRRAVIRAKFLRATWGCLGCGVTWSLVPWLRRAYARDFCDDACRQRHNYRARKTTP